jgi:hypothetical protein
MEFCDAMEREFERHLNFRCVDVREQEKLLVAAREGLEEFFMSKIHVVANYQSPEEKREDADLFFKTRLLDQFLTPGHLDIDPRKVHPSMIQEAADVLRQINMKNTPREKVACIVNSAGVIFNHLKNTSEGATGADDFLPVFIFTVIKSKIPHLLSTCEFIGQYRNPKVHFLYTPLPGIFLNVMSWCPPHLHIYCH